MGEPDYKDDTGKSVPLFTLCKMNPEWAASHIKNTRDEIERLSAEGTRLSERLETEIEYACNLQRIIERHCRGLRIEDELADKSPHLSNKLNRFLDSASGNQKS